ncbi:DUF1009 domain-containing protein [Hyphomicrobium methylovorum]|uniref:LpxI family protein n=1 Tax=Hyphomicrobium methylovorum TaxID=84 RepID=UPI0015E7656E|nr:UDP-2,3-diacylglucosamine diphosphatase LpxI [Hyphomicrobium methylovorum]MBA2125115.1 DUF1009 domain-containing protein [Hyphomicrobium methylovorum]
MDGLVKRIGIIAGSGSLPGEVARHVVGRGGFVHVIMPDGNADPALTEFPHTHVNWAQLGRTTAALKASGIRDIILLGGAVRPSFRNARPDFGFVRAIPRILPIFRGGGDDKVLRALVSLFGSEGFRVVGVADVAPELLVSADTLTAAHPTADATADIEKGFALISTLGRYDIGQGAVVAGGRVEAIEGAEGTDRMLARVARSRAAKNYTEASGVLVKCPKPGQDLRVDLPAIGPNTVANASAAGLAGIAVMAGGVLAAERDRMIADADRKAMFISGIAQTQESKASVNDSGKETIRITGRARVDAQTEADSRRAFAILAALSPFAEASAVVIVRGRVISVGANETPLDLLARTVELRTRTNRRAGVAVLAPGYTADKKILAAVDACHLAGVVVAQPAGWNIANELAAQARALRLFIAVAEHSQGGNGSQRT